MDLSKEVTMPIVAPVTEYYDLPGQRQFDLKAICCFVTLGFFLDDETYYTNRKAFRPSRRYTFDLNGNVAKEETHFKWHYTPREISFNEALEEFSVLIKRIVQRHVNGRAVILPISGGLDSRNLAAVLKDESKVFSYSYEFAGGANENFYGEAVAKALGFPHRSFQIQSGYLWKVINELAVMNGCYSDFINPRQMAIWKQLNDKGDLFVLGHGGDLFFDSMGVDGDLGFEEQYRYLLKVLIKPAGLALGQSLWDEWGLSGSLKEYLDDRLRHLLEGISIDNANARLRAFKTQYYVSRWTAVNLELFRRQKPISLPFVDDEICRFICTVPEEILAGRRIQIEYLKRNAPELARIPWQRVYPCNLYNYSRFESLPVRVSRGLIKARRIAKKAFLGKRSDVRNWELQFLGESNDRELRSYIFDSSSARLFSRGIAESIYNRFKSHPGANAHAMMMLLTLALFSQSLDDAKPNA